MVQYSVTKLKGNALFPTYTIAKSRKRMISDLKRRMEAQKRKRGMGLRNRMRDKIGR